MSRTYRFQQYDEGDWAEERDGFATTLSERKGGKPSKGTPADKRLKDNQGKPPAPPKK